MAENSKVSTEVKQILRRAAREKFLDVVKPPTSAFKNATEELLQSPNLTPQQREEYEQLLKGIELYEWNQGALQRGMRVIAKDEYKPEFVDENAGKYDNLTRKQIEAEYSGLFDEAADRFNGVRPTDFNDLNDRLKERLDANAGIRGERLDMTTRGNRLNRGRGHRLDRNRQSSTFNQSSAPKTNDFTRHSTTIGTMRDIARALIEAQQKRRSYGGPR